MKIYLSKTNILYGSLIVGVLLIPIVILLSYLHFLGKTMNARDIGRYCVENSAVQSASFRRWGDSATPGYGFWVSSDKSAERQELFIFKIMKFGPFDMNRLIFIEQVTSETTGPVGSVMFTPRDALGNDYDAAVMVFFSSNPNRIDRYTITLETLEQNSRLCTDKGGVTKMQEFIIVIPGLGTVSDNPTSAKIPTSAKAKFVRIEFWDSDVDEPVYSIP